MALQELAILLLVTAAVRAQSNFIPTCDSQFAVIRHPDDCATFYRCLWGQPLEMHCPALTVFSIKRLLCAWKGSVEDDCTVSKNLTTRSLDTTTTPTLSVDDRCRQDPEAIFPHPTECHQFYNCSYSYFFGIKYLNECPYPKLFDPVKLQCEDYDKVQCGQRRELVNACDYGVNQCLGPHCIPCHVRFPSCEGLPDSRNVYQYREWSPYYAECKDQRTVGTGTCEEDATLNMARFFSPETRQCVSLYEVPRDKGGYLLDCTGRQDGAHPDDATDRPNLYFVCQNGQRTDIRLCPEDQVYGNLTTSCISRVASFCSKNPASVLPHPTECQLFYNCSQTLTYTYFPQYMDECIYPQLFNVDTLRCEDYRNVKCGSRKEIVYKCEYRRYSSIPFGRPCSAYNPSCKGMADGPNVYQGREWTPYFVYCQDQRLNGSAMCERNSYLSVYQFFSPETRQCVILYEVPRDKGGYLLDCTGRQNGAYPDDATDRPNLYFVCQNGQRTDIQLCPEGQVYGSVTTPCVDHALF